MKMVPSRMKEAAVGMGCTNSQVVWRIVLPTALPGILTGVMLAVARASGETAPLLFTALFSNYWLVSDGGGGHHGAHRIAGRADLLSRACRLKASIEMAWAAALVLVLMVLVINIIGQVVSRKKV